MANAKTALTYSSEEIDVGSLLFGSHSYIVPYFQRPYTWGNKEFQDFLKDLDRASDEGSAQFLGAMILYERQSSVGDPKILEVVDGQQRLTTLTLFMCALISAFNRHELYSDAARLFRSFIWHNQPVSFGSNLRLHPSRHDRHHFNEIVKSLVSDKGLESELERPRIVYLPVANKAESKIDAQYKRIRRFIDGEIRKQDSGVLVRLVDTLSTLFTVVTIRLKDPTNCSRIFERLNFRGVPVTTGDLVRNEIFAKIASRDASEIENLNSQFWEPFYQRFQPDSQFNDYFFPYGLVLNSNVSKGDVFSKLRDGWAEISEPAEIVAQLRTYQDPFLDFCNNTNELCLPKDVKTILGNLRRLGSPSSIYPFVMRLSREVKDGKLGSSAAAGAVKILEGFLTRRAVCGLEPTGLHAVFKRLWNDAASLGLKQGLPADQTICAATVTAALLAHATQPWPNDTEFSDALRTRAVAESAIANFLLSEYEVSLGGDIPSNIPWKEHILPQSIAGTDWEGLFDESSHSKWLHTLANVIPLSPDMNRKLGNFSYATKQEAYRKDSMFKSARLLASQFSAWNPAALDIRAQELVIWGLSRWPKSG